jgi:hypothetical protein
MRHSPPSHERVQALSARFREAITGLWEPGHPPSNPRVALLLRRIRRHESTLVDALADIYVCAVRDKRPEHKLNALAIVLAAFVEAERAPAPERPLDLTNRVETQKDAALDVAQMRLATERSEEAKRECLTRAYEYRPALDAFVQALEREVFTPAVPSADFPLTPAA